MGALNPTKPKARLANSTLLFIIAGIIFLLMYGIALLTFPVSFKQFQTFFDFFNLNAALFIVTLGMCIVMIGGGIDISVGAVCGLVTMACALLLESGAGNIWGAFFLALGIGLAFGLMHGYLIAYLEIQPFIITLAGMFLAQGLLTTLHREPLNVTRPAFVALRSYRIEIPWLGTVNRLGVFIPCEIRPGVIVVVVLVVLYAIMMKWTRFGRNLYAVGGNRQSARMLGINVKKTIFFSYVLCGLTAGISGFVFLLTTGAGNIGNGSLYEMKAIAANVMGGILLNGGVGNLLGAPIGTLTLLTINELIRAAGVQSNLQAIVSGLLLYLFIVLQSIVMALRGRRQFKLALPPWLKGQRPPGEQAAGNQG
ncbi:MAG: sugar ABC transporter permease YjfF [Firmicutes bacterium]|nr:sugar ABC transporter permease YjfF [Bacillota bacterium]